ncbi:MAG: lauroyl acyltransferase [Alphaproteobacteria bacterium]|nr:lauroyl acyltransferase [Alphaproteobacteria bacterium]
MLTAYGIFRALPIDWASGFGGWVGRNLGPRLGLSRRARRNLALAMPELTAAEIERIVVDMWDNLGRSVGEMPHVPALDPFDGSGRIEVLGLENLAAAKAAGGAVFFSGHFANWELMPAMAHRHGLELELIYRAANNPLVERLLLRLRIGRLHPKGAKGARLAVMALKEGRPIGLLADQKMNDGIAVPFFGRPAMTAPALAELARKFQAPIFPIRTERLTGARFRITVMRPWTVPESGDRRADVAEGMRRVNAILEEWIRARPAQWLWLHRRWPES